MTESYYPRHSSAEVEQLRVEQPAPWVGESLWLQSAIDRAVERMRARRDAQPVVEPPRSMPPRYDEVYWRGASWLNGEGGDE